MHLFCFHFILLLSLLFCQSFPQSFLFFDNCDNLVFINLLFASNQQNLHHDHLNKIFSFLLTFISPSLIQNMMILQVCLLTTFNHLGLFAFAFQEQKRAFVFCCFIQRCFVLHSLILQEILYQNCFSPTNSNQLRDGAIGEVSRR